MNDDRIIRNADGTITIPCKRGPITMPGPAPVKTVTITEKHYLELLTRLHIARNQYTHIRAAYEEAQRRLSFMGTLANNLTTVSNSIRSIANDVERTALDTNALLYNAFKPNK